MLNINPFIFPSESPKLLSSDALYKYCSLTFFVAAFNGDGYPVNAFAIFESPS